MPFDMEINEKERYMQINDYFPKSGAEFTAFWANLAAGYSGYAVFFCYHGTEPPAAFLDSIGARLADDCVRAAVTPEGFSPGGSAGAVRVSEANFDEFALLHDKRSAGMYWTGARLRERLDAWAVFLLGGGYVMMSLAHGAEVFALAAENDADARGLLSAAVQAAFAAGQESVLFMIDAADVLQRDAAEAVGFVTGGFYRGYEAIVCLPSAT